MGGWLISQNNNQCIVWVGSIMTPDPHTHTHMFHCFTNHRNLLSPLPKRHSLRSRDLRIREDPHGAIRCTRPIVKPCSFGMQRFGTVGKPEKPSAICDVCWDGWRERVEIHLCYGVNGGDTINTVGGFLDWGVGRRNLTFRLLRGG